LKLFHINWPKPEERKESDRQQEENKMATSTAEGIQVEASSIKDSMAEKLVMSL
jgi:hypothetical protein